MRRAPPEVPCVVVADTEQATTVFPSPGPPARLRDRPLGPSLDEPSSDAPSYEGEYDGEDDDHYS